MRFLFVIGLIAALSSTAFADEPRSGATAVELSVAGTVMPAVVFASGLDEKGTPTTIITALGIGVITPSLGEIYAGRYVTYGMAARATGLTLALYGSHQADALCSWYGTCYEETQRARKMMFGGLILYAAGTVYDIATAPRAAHHYNERRVTIAP